MDKIKVSKKLDISVETELLTRVVNTEPQKSLDPKQREENLKSAFRLFDTHSDGTVSVKELEEILGLTEQIDKGIIMELLKDIGKTEEDELTFEEFKLFIMQYIQQKGDDKNYNTSTENTRISCTTDTKEDI